MFTIEASPLGTSFWWGDVEYNRASEDHEISSEKSRWLLMLVLKAGFIHQLLVANLKCTSFLLDDVGYKKCRPDRLPVQRNLAKGKHCYGHLNGN